MKCQPHLAKLILTVPWCKDAWWIAVWLVAANYVHCYEFRMLQYIFRINMLLELQLQRPLCLLTLKAIDEYWYMGITIEGHLAGTLGHNAGTHNLQTFLIKWPVFYDQHNLIVAIFYEPFITWLCVDLECFLINENSSEWNHNRVHVVNTFCFLYIQFC